MGCVIPCHKFWTSVLVITYIKHWWDFGMNYKKKPWQFFLPMSFQHPDIIPSIKIILSRSWSEIFWISLNQVLVCSVWYYWLLASDRGGSLFTPDISRFHARELSPLPRNFLSSRLIFLFHHFWYFHNSDFTFAELRWWTSHILAKGAGKGFGRVRKMRTRL